MDYKMLRSCVVIQSFSMTKKYEDKSEEVLYIFVSFTCLRITLFITSFGALCL